MIYNKATQAKSFIWSQVARFCDLDEINQEKNREIKVAHIETL